MNSHIPPEYQIAPRAKAAIKGQWPIALPIGFLAGILHTVEQMVSNLNLTPLMEKTMVLMEQGYPVEYVTQWMSENALSAALPIALLSLLAALVTPALSMGMHAYALKLLRGEEGRMGDILCRMNIFFKVLGLSIMTGLRIFLWTMLGVAAYLLVVYLVTLAGGAEFIVTLIPLLACVAVIPGVMAMFRYMLAEYAMADKPETKINDAIRLSKKLMKKRVLRLLALLMPWTLLSYLGGTLLQLLLGSVVGMAVGMLTSLACSVYMEMLKGSFYLTWRENEEKEPEIA